MTATATVPKTARERGKIAPEKLAHIVLRTGDAPRLIDWYKTVLEAEVMIQTPVVSFLTYDEEHHRIAIAQMPGLPRPGGVTTGLEHVAFTYRDADDLFATYERLKTLGVTPYWTINHGPTLSFYYRDPDGNQCELQIDLHKDAAETNAWFAKSDFATNPIGVKFDPQDMIARYRAGAAPVELFARPVIDPALVMAQFPEQMFATSTFEDQPAPASMPDHGADISGQWAWTSTGPMGERKGTASFIVRGEVLEGRWVGQLHNQPITRGAWSRGKAHWELDIEVPVKGTITFDVVLSEGQLKGAAAMGAMGSMEITLTRADV